MIKKFTIILMLALLVGTAGATSRGLVSHEIQVVDELGRPVTDVTNLYIYLPGGTTDAVIYADRQLQNVIVIPMLTAGGSDNSTLVNGRAHWWGPDGYDFSVSNSNAMGPLTNSGHILRTSSDGTLVFPSYLQSMSTTAWGDAQSISMGTGPEIVINAGQVHGTMSFIPLSDDYNFIIGSVNPAYTCSLYVPTGATYGLVIAGAAFTWDGGAVLMNHNFNANVGLCTGTSTGATTIGNAAGGAIIVDTAATITVSADEGITQTNVGAGFDQVFTTAGNFQIIASEAASLTAFNVDVTGAVSGMTFNTTEGPIVMTAGDATEGDFTLVAENLMTFTSADVKTFDGAANELWVIDGTAGGFTHTLDFTDATGDIVWTFPDIGTGAGDDLAVMCSTFITNYPEIIDSVWMAANQIRFEGATADAFESVITSADITGGVVTWTLADMAAADVLSVMGSTFVTNAPEIAGSVWGAENQIRFEGAAADAFESVIQSADITVGVVTWMLPDLAGADILAFMGSTLATNAPGIADSVTGGLNQLIFEGNTEDVSEIILTAEEPTAAVLYTLPDAAAATYGFVVSTLAANGVDIVNSVTGGTNQLIWEGTVDGDETILQANDAVGADAILELPNDSGDLVYAPVGAYDHSSGAGAFPTTHVMITYESLGAEAVTLGNGIPGQIIVIVMDVHAGDGTFTPDTAAGWTSLLFEAVGDTVSLLWIDTLGWVIIGSTGDGAPPAITI